MHLLALLPADWETRILATDLSTRVLRRAQEAIWPLEKSHEIPPKYLKRFMLKGVGGQSGKMRAGPEIRDAVHFLRANLTEEPIPVEGTFDLVFCRNVLIYFPPAVRARVCRSLLRRLAPDGYLFLGHAETLTGLDEPVRCLGPNIYAHGAKPRN
jgi:chemotaxis protein methyltransferase CheR